MTINANIRNDLPTVFLKFFSLLIVWLLGLAVGYSLFEPSYLSLMRSALLQPVSIVGLFVSIFLPLIFSVSFILFEKPILLLIVCFIKAVAYGFSCTLIAQSFQVGSWLMRFLLLFSDSFFLLIMITVCLNGIFDKERLHSKTIIICTLLCVLITGSDYIVVSHILERLF